MGTWGTGLYSNDSACDIRGDYIDKLKRGKTNDEATQELINSNRDIMGDVEEEPLFWFALSYANKGKIYFKYGKKQRLLESSYLITDSLNDLSHTALGECVLRLQNLYDTL